MAQESMTKKISSALVWIILVLVLLGLGGYGVTNFGRSVRSIGGVGDTEIDIRDYQRALSQELRALEAQTKERVSLSDAIARGRIDQRVQQRLLIGAALDNETARLGISVGDGIVAEQIRTNPAFFGPDGKFDRDTYRYALQQLNMSEADYERILRRETARSILQRAVLAGISAPEAEKKAFLDFAGERRNFTWVRIGQKDLAEPLPPPTEEDLKAYYQAHSENFTLPEMKRITYVWLTPEMLLDKVEIDEDRLREIYDNRKSEYVIPEKRVVERLVFASPDEAKAAMEGLEKGETGFEDLVKARGLTPDDITLEITSPDDLEGAGEAVFARDAPGLVGEFDTDLGPAIINLRQIVPGQETSFEEAREGLEIEARLDKARREIDKMTGELEDLIASGATLEEAAGESDLQSGQIDWWEGVGGGIADYEAFRKAAKKLAKGDFPEIRRLEDGGLFALRLDEIVPPRIEEFEKAKKKVRDAWENQELEKALRKRAEALAPRMAEGADLSAEGLTQTIEEDITRTDYIQGTPPDFLKDVFSMKKGDVKVIDGFGAVYLVRLDDVLPPDESRPDYQQIATMLADQLRQSIAQDLFLAYVADLEEKAGIRLDQAAINAVHAQFR